MSQSHIPGTFEPTTDSATTRTRRMSGPTEVNRPTHHLHTDSQPLPKPSASEQEYLRSDVHVPGTQDRKSQPFGKGEATGQVPQTPWNSEVASGAESDISDFSGFKTSGTHASSFAGIPTSGFTPSTDRSSGQTGQFRTPTDQFASTGTQASHPKFGSEFKPDEAAKSPFADVYAENGGRVASSTQFHSGQKYNLSKEGADTDAIFGGARDRTGDQEPVHFQHSLAGQPGSTSIPGGIGYESDKLQRHDDKHPRHDQSAALHRDQSDKLERMEHGHSPHDQSKTTETMRHGPGSRVTQTEKSSIGSVPGGKDGMLLCKRILRRS